MAVKKDNEVSISSDFSWAIVSEELEYCKVLIINQSYMAADIKRSMTRQKRSASLRLSKTIFPP